MKESNYNCSGGNLTTKDTCVPLQVNFSISVVDNKDVFYNIYGN